MNLKVILVLMGQGEETLVQTLQQNMLKGGYQRDAYKNGEIYKNLGERLPALAAFPEDLGLSPSIHMVAHNLL